MKKFVLQNLHTCLSLCKLWGNFTHFVAVNVKLKYILLATPGIEVTGLVIENMLFLKQLFRTIIISYNNVLSLF